MGNITFDNIVHAVSFSPSGKVLAVGGETNEIAMLMADDNFEKKSSLICSAGVMTLSWSPDSSFLASGGEDMQITVWSLRTDQVSFKLPKVRDWYCSVAFSPSMQWIATCGFGCKDVVLHPISFTVDSAAPESDQSTNATVPAITIGVPGVSSVQNVEVQSHQDNTRMTKPVNRQSMIGAGTCKFALPPGAQPS
jgi:WD40 repeat protein